MGKWRRFNKSHPCPVCGGIKWCGISEDGAVVHCMKVPNGKALKTGGWIHRLKDSPKRDVAAKLPKPTRKLPSKHWVEVHKRCRLDIKSRKVDFTLFQTREIAERLQVGWLEAAGRVGALSIPMRYPDMSISGIALRAGGNYCVPGSRAGLFIPTGLACTGRLYITEGYTDCAAVLSLGEDCIGRRSCHTGDMQIIDFLKLHSYSEVVICADNDNLKLRPDGSVFHPGTDGGRALAHRLNTLKISTGLLVPATCKDMRDWVNSGLNRVTLNTFAGSSIRRLYNCKEVSHARQKGRY